MTIPRTEIGKRELLFRLRRRAKRWQFGIEVGTNSGYEHYQVRYECSNNDYSQERRYWQDIKCELQEAGGWSEYERKDGNFYTSMDDYLGKYRWGKLQEFQLYLDANTRNLGDRKISIIIDTFGGTGKTFWARRCDLNGTGIYIDGTDTSNIIRDIYDVIENDWHPTKYRFIIDLSRADRCDRTILGKLEVLKNGFLNDGRYQYRRKWITPPDICVLTNNEPDWTGLTKDRWDKFFIKREEKVIKVVHYPRKGVKEEVSFKS